MTELTEREEINLHRARMAEFADYFDKLKVLEDELDRIAKRLDGIIGVKDE